MCLVSSEKGVDVTTFIIKKVITCGEKTCAIEPGKFCPEFGAKSFGTLPWCLHFNVELFDSDGWVQRCPQCLIAEREATR